MLQLDKETGVLLVLAIICRLEFVSDDVGLAVTWPMISPDHRSGDEVAVDSYVIDRPWWTA